MLKVLAWLAPKNFSRMRWENLSHDGREFASHPSGRHSTLYLNPLTKQPCFHFRPRGPSHARPKFKHAPREPARRFTFHARRLYQQTPLQTEQAANSLAKLLPQVAPVAGDDVEPVQHEIIPANHDRGQRRAADDAGSQSRPHSGSAATVAGLTLVFCQIPYL